MTLITRFNNGTDEDTNLFIVPTAAKSLTIAEFSPASGDRIVFTSEQISGIAPVFVQSGTDAVLRLANGVMLTIQNVSAASLSEKDFSVASPLLSGQVNSWMAGRAVGDTVVGTGRNDEIKDTFGGMTLSGGAGDDTYIAYNQSTRIVEKAGGGIDTVVTWASSYALADDQELENLTLKASGAADGTGNRLNNVIVGGMGNNLLTGGRGNDLLTGGGGNDTFALVKGDGFDTITDFAATGTGRDVLRLGGFGLTTFADIQGRMVQVGGDVVIALGGSDGVLLRGVKLADLTAANFQFAFSGGSGNDVVQGGSGDDFLTGGAGRDTFVIAQGGGSDTIADFSAGVWDDVLTLRNYGFTDFASVKAAMVQSGTDTLVSLGDGQVLRLQNVRASAIVAENVVIENDTASTSMVSAMHAFATAPTAVASGAPTAWISTNVAGATLTGKTGNDQLSAGAANNILVGGDGDDTYYVNGTTKVVEKAGEGRDTIVSWNTETVLSDNVENLTIKAAGAAIGTGNDLANVIIGGAGANVLTGGRGDDVLTGGGGGDVFVMRPGDGQDTITDFAAAGSEADVVRLDGYSFASFAALKARMMQVGADTVIAVGVSDSIVLRNTRVADLTAANFDLLRVADTLVAAPGGSTLDGGSGNDTLIGGAGRDVFVASKGNGSDTIINFTAGASGDVLDLRGCDLKTLAEFKSAAVQSGSDTVVSLGNGETLTLKGARLADLTDKNVVLEFSLAASGGPSKWVTTSADNQTLTGTAGNDQLQNSKVAPTLIGGAGDDTYLVSRFSDTVIEKAGEGIDTVITWGDGYLLPDNQSIENITLNGVTNSSAWGNKLDNIVTGNAGNNLLNGAKGNDILTGNAGHDTFVVAKGEGNDVITDFKGSEDLLRLDGFAFKSFAEVAATMSQVGTSVILNLGGGQNLILQNTVVADLTAHNLVLPLDTSGLIRTFNDDFNTFSTYDGKGGTWLTRYEWSGDAAYTLATNAESHLYVDPTFKGITGKEASASLGLNPFSLDDGDLVITARPIDPSLAANMGTYRFTSGMISNEAVFSQTYGHFEIKADLPVGKGTWPAFWLLPTDNSWPPELDVLETFGDVPSMVHSGVHSNTDAQENGDWLMVGDLSGKHSFSVTWTPYTVTFYVDNHQTAQYATPTDMNTSMYLIANLAMGGAGSWSGAAAADTTAEYRIDSISAWQLPEYTLEHYTLLTSAAATRVVSGTAAAEALTGSDAADWLDGRGGADTLSGGLGDDTYVVSDAGTKVVEAFGAGVDTVRSSVSYALTTNIENLTLTGTSAINGTGNSQSNILVGNSGDNVLTGGGGNDILTGGAGHDTFVFGKGAGSDIITDFEAGTGQGDVAQIDGYGFTSFAGVQSAMTQHGADVWLALSPTDTLVFRNHHVSEFAADDFRLPSELPVSGVYLRAEFGTTGNETVVGTGSNNYLDGKGGNDTLIGGWGDDTYKVYATGTTTIVEKAGEGVDTVEAYQSYKLPDNVENLKVMAWYQTGTGNELDNRIWGSGGPDVLNGKGGNDWLYGGAGNDTFVHERNSGFDTIADFHVNTGSGERDTLRLVGYGSNASLSHVGDVWTVTDAAGSDSFQITGVTNLTRGDFLFA